MSKALIIIDYTLDFVAHEGKLTCGEAARKLDERIKQITETFYLNRDYIVVANDVHIEGDTYHPEYELFPPHNIQGTAGRFVYGDTGDYINELVDVHFIDKTRYSAFAGTDLYLRLRERNINEIHLVGVCTDICILHTAVDAYNLGFKIFIHEDGVASFNEAGHEWALGHFENVLGATVVKGYR